jgi:hypothetical protein
MAEERFHCPRCDALYSVVRVKGEPGKTYPPICCRVCHGTLAASNGDHILKYFLIRRPPNRRPGPGGTSPAATNTTPASQALILHGRGQARLRDWGPLGRAAEGAYGSQISYRPTCPLSRLSRCSIRGLRGAGATSAARVRPVRISDQAFAGASPTNGQGKPTEGNREVWNLVGMPSNRYRGPPMTLANMRAQDVRSLWVV